MCYLFVFLVPVDLFGVAAVLTVDRLFDLDADLMEEWATEEVVDGLCEAAEQTKSVDCHVMSHEYQANVTWVSG